MSRLRTITRRTFIVGTAAVAGGIAVGYTAYKWPVHNPLKDNLDDNEAALTPYVLINRNGITIITPRVDLGQGAYSMQAALVAEELDVAWGEFAVSPGVPSAAYYNTAVLEEGFPFASTDDGFMARRMRSAGPVIAKFMGLQITGGSSTVPDGYEKLRVAGAVARDMLLSAAAQESGIAKSQLTTRDGAVVFPDGRTMAYTALAPTAATLDVPSGVTLKPSSEWRLLGKPMRRLDMVSKSTGTAVYGIDLRFENMVFATVRTNPRLGGGMRAVDTTAAKAVSGVIKVVQITGGVGVIATNTWRAFKAAALLEPDWGAAPYPATSAEHFAEVAASFTNERLDNRKRDDGDVEAVLAQPFAAAMRLEAEYRIPYLAHAPLEPMSAVVQLKNGRLDIWTSTQIPRFVEDSAARITGLDKEHIHLHVQIAGGSFGRRLEDDYVRQAVELAVAHEGVPIKMTWSREEDMTHDMPRCLAIARARGVVQDRHVHAYDLSIAAPSTTASQYGRINQTIPGPDSALARGAWDQPFAIPHYRVSAYRVPELVPISSWRSVAASGNGFLHECFLDELMHAAGADPLAERIRLCTDAASRAVLEAVGELSNWGATLPEGSGRGLAFTLSFGVPVAEVVQVTNTPDGIRIDQACVVVDVGRVLDPVNLEAQLTGGVIWGLGHAMNAELTYADGMAQQTNYHVFEAMRLHQAPRILTRALETQDVVRGIGEPAVPPAAPALANAIFAATGQRIRELPLGKHIRFV